MKDYCHRLLNGLIPCDEIGLMIFARIMRKHIGVLADMSYWCTRLDGNFSKCDIYLIHLGNLRFIDTIKGNLFESHITDFRATFDRELRRTLHSEQQRREAAELQAALNRNKEDFRQFNNLLGAKVDNQVNELRDNNSAIVPLPGPSDPTKNPAPVEDPKKTPAADPAKNTTPVEDPKITPAADPTKKTAPVEDPKKTPAAEPTKNPEQSQDPKLTPVKIPNKGREDPPKKPIDPKPSAPKRPRVINTEGPKPKKPRKQDKIIAKPKPKHPPKKRESERIKKQSQKEQEQPKKQGRTTRNSKKTELVTSKGKLSIVSIGVRRPKPKKKTKRRYTCNTCEEKFNVAKEMLVHIRDKHPDVRFHCKYCPKKFITRHGRWKHYKVHNIQKSEFVCKTCKKIYAFKYQLIEHERRHLKNKGKIFKCDTKGCDSFFSTRRAMKRHTKDQHSDETFNCKYSPCDYSGVSTGLLQQHYRVKHTQDAGGPEGFESHCKIVFKNPYQRSKHQKDCPACIKKVKRRYKK